MTLSQLKAQVTLPHLEQINYVSGGLQTQTGWTSLNSGDDLAITTGNLSYNCLPASVGNKVTFDGGGIDAGKLFTQQTSGTVYYSFLLNVSSLGGINTNGGYFTGFAEGSASTIFGATVWTKNDGAGGYNIGINPRTTAANTVWSGSNTIGTTYLVVISYQMITGSTNDIVKMWINPALGTSEPAALLTGTNTGTDLANLNRILIRQDNTSSTPFVQMDEIRIGTTWADVTPNNAPTISTFSPSSGYNGTTITINGTNLTSASAVTVGGTAASIVTNTATEITAKVGAGTTGTVAVSTTCGTATSGANFTYNGYITTTTGNWNTASTWLGNSVPPANADVTIANDAILDIAATVGSATFTGGKLSLGANNLTATTVTGASATSYVVTDGSGTLTIKNTGTTATTFPVGPSSTLYHPATITNSGSNGDFSVAVSSTDLPCTAPANSVKANWSITTTSPMPNCAITLDYTGAAVGGSYTLSASKVTHCTGVTPDYNGSVTGTVASGSGFTSFSPFGVATDLAVLPVSFNNIKATQQGSTVNVEWTNLTEKDIKNYSIERSADGRNFVIIGNHAAAKNNDSKASYNFVDASPLALNYYRINATSLNGSIKYSAIVKVDNKAANAGVSIYPNPVVDGNLVLQTAKLATGNYTFKIVNAFGQVLQTQKIALSSNSSTQTISLNNSISSGKYTLVLVGENVSINKSFLVK
jgi:hypothetical protein